MYLLLISSRKKRYRNAAICSVLGEKNVSKSAFWVFVQVVKAENFDFNDQEQSGTRVHEELQNCLDADSSHTQKTYAEMNNVNRQTITHCFQESFNSACKMALKLVFTPNS